MRQNDTLWLIALVQARAAFSVCRKFFDQPVEEKVKVQVTTDTNTSGYGRVEQEKLVCIVNNYLCDL